MEEEGTAQNDGNGKGDGDTHKDTTLQYNAFFNNWVRDEVVFLLLLNYHMISTILIFTRWMYLARTILWDYHITVPYIHRFCFRTK